jgi:hypothetical protein
LSMTPIYSTEVAVGGIVLLCLVVLSPEDFMRLNAVKDEETIADERESDAMREGPETFALQ